MSEKIEYEKGLYFPIWEYLKKYNSFLNICIGGRGTGKTYGTLKGLIEDKKKFIYMRMSEIELEYSSGKDSPFKSINNDLGMNIEMVKKNKKYSIIDRDEGNLIGIGLDLLKGAKAKGSDYTDFDFIVFDEFIPLLSVKTATYKKSGDLLFQFLETVNRNREIEGRESVRLILLSNAESLDSPILNFWGLSDVIYQMINNSIEFDYLSDRDISIYIPKDVPISSKKKETKLYNSLPKNNKVVEMSLSNNFYTENFSNVGRLPNNILMPLFSIEDLYFYDVKNTNLVYCCRRKHNRNNFDSFKQAKEKIGIELHALNINDMLFFENYDVKNKYRNFV